MKLLQKMGVFGSRVNFLAHSGKVYFARKKVVDELKSVLSEKSGIDFDDDLKHFHEVPNILDDYVLVNYNYYLGNSYYKIMTYFKKYRDAIGSLLFGAGQKFANKTDKRIDKADLKNNTEDVKLLEEEKENIGEFFTDLMDDYEYYLKVFEKLNEKFGIKQDDSLNLY